MLTLKASCYETFYQSGETSDPATGINTRKMFLLNLARAKAKLKWVSFEFRVYLWIFLSAGLGEKTQDCRSTSSGATRWTTPGGRGWVGRGGEVRLISHISFIFRCRHLHSVARDREDSRITGTRFRIYVCDPVSLLTRLHKVLCKVKAKLKLIFHSTDCIYWMI